MTKRGLFGRTAKLCHVVCCGGIMVCNLPVMKCKRRKEKILIVEWWCRKQDDKDGFWTSRSALLDCREFRKPDMWGTAVGSRVSVYMSCVCKCVCVGCLRTVESGSGLFWWSFMSVFVYPLKSREHKVKAKHWKLRLCFGPSTSVCILAVYAEYHQMQPEKEQTDWTVFVSCHKYYAKELLACCWLVSNIYLLHNMATLQHVLLSN